MASRCILQRLSPPRCRLAVAVFFVTLLAAVRSVSQIDASGLVGTQRTPFMDLLARAGAYVADYEKRVSAVVAREEYVQEVKERSRTAAISAPGERMDHQGENTARLKAPNWSGARRREMTSDVLLVQLPDETWFGFRDVIEVDGSQVRGRENRLQELFVKARASTRQILDESARYNIGPIQRNTNIPTYALLYLHPLFQPRFTFEKAGEETLNGTLTWIVSYTESVSPTIVRDRERGKDLLSRGRFWIDVRTGQVLRTELIVGGEAADVRAQTIVTYRVNPVLGMPVPADMKEFYDYPGRPWDPYIECTATYSNFRRFDVKVEEKIVIK